MNINYLILISFIFNARTPPHDRQQIPNNIEYVITIKAIHIYKLDLRKPQHIKLKQRLLYFIQLEDNLNQDQLDLFSRILHLNLLTNNF